MTELIRDYRFSVPLAILIVLAIVGAFSSQMTGEGALIPFEPDRVSSQAEIYSKPGASEMRQGDEIKHYFGTDQIGRDVAARLIHGIPIAFKVGIGSALLSLLIALIFGALSGFIGNRRHKISLLKLLIGGVLIVLAHFYSREWSFVDAGEGLFVFSIIRYGIIFAILMIAMSTILSYLPDNRSHQIYIPWDTIVLKCIEVFKSIPRLFLLLALFAIITMPSVFWVIVIIGLIRWPRLTRIIRADIIVTKGEDFVRSAHLMGLSDARIFVRHILPNIYKPIIVLTAFNMGSAILIESSLSFLQIGLPADTVSWGRMLGESRNYISAWWLAIGPGFLIFVMVLCFNLVADGLSRHFDALSQSDLK